MITKGSIVSFEYTLSDQNGDLIQSNKGKEPVRYKHGEGEIIPGLEKAFTGMAVDEEKSVKVAPEEAYGRVDPDNFKEVPKANVPAAALKVGTPLSARSSDGEDVVIHVHEVKKDTVVLDFNHPLAGKTLNFDVKVLEIE